MEQQKDNGEKPKFDFDLEVCRKIADKCEDLEKRIDTAMKMVKPKPQTDAASV